MSLNPEGLSAVILGLQSVALAVLILRLLPGRTRIPAVQPGDDTALPPCVSVIVATLNEAKRIAPCLSGLKAQGTSLLEVLVVDSNSTDGTRELVEAAASHDSRIRLLTDSPLPSGWVGKVWALETGLRSAKGEWILGIDADTVPKPGMVAGIMNVLREQQLDAASFGPRFIGQTPQERFIQPAMLVTLVYRTGASGAAPPKESRLLANGQCFVARRSLLNTHGGYAVARDSFSDDVTLARHLSRNGARVGFLDGSRIIDVRAYASLSEMWREWGRSFDLKDNASFAARWLDVLFIWLTMALPLPLLVSLGVLGFIRGPVRLPENFGDVLTTTSATMFTALVTINALLLGIRLAMVFAIRGSYAERGWAFWLSWIGDIPAAIRLTLSTARRPRVWRGRMYNERKQVQT